jgi:hypothetical protein
MSDNSVGEVFRLKDERFQNRTIKLLSVVDEHPTKGTIYLYQTMTHDNSPWLETTRHRQAEGMTIIIPGRKGRISAKTLAKEWEKVSK